MGVSALTVYRGDLSLAKATRKAGNPMVISSSCLIPMEAIAAEVPGVRYQAYLPPGKEEIKALLARVARCGIETWL